MDEPKPREINYEDHTCEGCKDAPVIRVRNAMFHPSESATWLMPGGC